MAEFLVANEGGMQKSLLRHYEAEKLTHVRHFREDLQPHIDRVERISKLNGHTSKSEYQYLGSIPRIMIDDWLRKEGKNWNDYATDKELKAKFMSWFKSDCQKLMAEHYQERRLSANRSLTGRTAPKFGATVLDNYRKEVSNA